MPRHLAVCTLVWAGCLAIRGTWAAAADAVWPGKTWAMKLLVEACAYRPKEARRTAVHTSPKGPSK